MPEVADLTVEAALDEGFLAEGILQLTRELRSLLKNWSRSHVLHFHLPGGGRVTGSLFANLGYLHARDLASWCQAQGLAVGDVLVMAPMEDHPDHFALAPAPRHPTIPERETVAGATASGTAAEAVSLVAGLSGATVSSDANAFLLGRLARRGGLRRGFEHLVCLDRVRGVDLYDHQLEAVRRILQDMGGRGILADEVGLGKTVEAGLVLKELVLRGMVSRFVVFTPASLVLQWQEELRTKFDIDCRTHVDAPDWHERSGIVVSLDTAKGRRNRERLGEGRFDLVIVDEAHKLKNQRTLNWTFINSLRPRFLLLLTATPVQNSIEEIFNLVFLVKPGLLGTRRQFRSTFISRRDGRIPRDPDGLKRLLSSVMVRHRRDETDVDFPGRRVELAGVPFSDGEERLYAGLYAFVKDHYGGVGYFDEGLNRLTLMVLERLVTSSPQGLRVSLGKLLERGALSEPHRRRLREVAGLAETVTVCAKADRLLSFVEGTPEQVVVYTQFRETQDYLVGLLRERGVGTEVFHGGLSATARDRVLASFAGGSRVLVSTDSGGEGINLQFCRNLVNYDLPWNPMRVEQRIGRVHRLGQRRDVRILNLFYLDSIEEYVVKLLSDKIRLFTLVVGELDAILGFSAMQEGLETTIMETYLEAGTRDERIRRFDDLGERFGAALERHESIKDAQNRFFRF